MFVLIITVVHCGAIFGWSVQVNIIYCYSPQVTKLLLRKQSCYCHFVSVLTFCQFCDILSVLVAGTGRI